MPLLQSPTFQEKRFSFGYVVLPPLNILKWKCNSFSNLGAAQFIETLWFQTNPFSYLSSLLFHNQHSLHPLALMWIKDCFLFTSNPKNKMESGTGENPVSKSGFIHGCPPTYAKMVLENWMNGRSTYIEQLDTSFFQHQPSSKQQVVGVDKNDLLGWTFLSQSNNSETCCGVIYFDENDQYSFWDVDPKIKGDINEMDGSVIAPNNEHLKNTIYDKTMIYRYIALAKLLGEQESIRFEFFNAVSNRNDWIKKTIEKDFITISLGQFHISAAQRHQQYLQQKRLLAMTTTTTTTTTSLKRKRTPSPSQTETLETLFEEQENDGSSSKKTRSEQDLSNTSITSFHLDYVELSDHLTEEQKEIVRFQPEPGQIVTVFALPGTGKTETCSEILKRHARAYPNPDNSSMICPKRKFLYTMLNTKVVEDAKLRIGDEIISSGAVDCMTFYALANAFIRPTSEHLGDAGFQGVGKDVKVMLETYWLSTDVDLELHHFQYRKGGSKTLAYRTATLNEAKDIWRRMLVGSYPYTHQAYLKHFCLKPEAIKWMESNWGNVMVDEAQDLPPVFIEFLSKLDGCCVYIIGDENQQIYKFAGAESAFSIREFCSSERIIGDDEDVEEIVKRQEREEKEKRREKEKIAQSTLQNKNQEERKEIVDLFNLYKPFLFKEPQPQPQPQQNSGDDEDEDSGASDLTEPPPEIQNAFERIRRMEEMQMLDDYLNGKDGGDDDNELEMDSSVERSKRRKFVKFYLTKSFRFGQDVATLLNMFIYERKQKIIKMEGTSNPTRIDVSGENNVLKVLEQCPFPEKVAVIARFNKTLLGFVLLLIRHRIPFHVIGNPIASMVRTTLNYARSANEGQWNKDMFSSRARDIQKDKYAAKDALQCLYFVQRNPDAMLLEQFDDYHLLQPTTSRLILTSVHQAKGMEFDNVLIADDFPPQFESEDQEEETNILFVAISRAKQRLFLGSVVPNLL